uniref:Uncharacterized protein n=1 Tax=Lygus hesperus TaxID=30085 RepID=A0A146LE82_LYGHE
MALPGSEVKCPRPSTQNENNVTGTSDGQPAVISEYEMNIEEEIEIKPEQNIVPHDKDVGPSSLHCLKMKDEPDICHDVGSLEDKIIGHEVILPANVKEEPMDDDDEDSPCNDPLANSTHFLTGTSVDDKVKEERLSADEYSPNNDPPADSSLKLTGSSVDGAGGLTKPEGGPPPKKSKPRSDTPEKSRNKHSPAASTNSPDSSSSGSSSPSWEWSSMSSLSSSSSRTTSSGDSTPSHELADEVARAVESIQKVVAAAIMETSPDEPNAVSRATNTSPVTLESHAPAGVERWRLRTGQRVLSDALRKLDAFNPATAGELRRGKRKIRDSICRLGVIFMGDAAFEGSSGKASSGEEDQPLPPQDGHRDQRLDDWLDSATRMMDQKLEDHDRWRLEKDQRDVQVSQQMLENDQTAQSLQAQLNELEHKYELIYTELHSRPSTSAQPLVVPPLLVSSLRARADNIVQEESVLPVATPLEDPSLALRRCQICLQKNPSRTWTCSACHSFWSRIVREYARLGANSEEAIRSLPTCRHPRPEPGRITCRGCRRRLFERAVLQNSRRPPAIPLHPDVPDEDVGLQKGEECKETPTPSLEQEDKVKRRQRRRERRAKRARTSALGSVTPHSAEGRH